MVGKKRILKEQADLSGLTVKKKKVYENYMDSSLVRFNSEVATIEPPSNLNKKAKEAWNITIPSLLKMGVLGPLDLPLLEQAFFFLNEAYTAQAELKKFDKENKELPLDEKIGKRNKILLWHRNSINEFTKIVMNYGISPQARSHLANMANLDNKKESEDPLDILIG